MSSPPPDHPDLIYKIASAAAFKQFQETGSFTGMPIDVADGFIHFSTAQQVGETLRLHFRGDSDLMLIAVRTADVSRDLVWEPSRGGQLFPHLYAPIPLSAVAWAEPVSVGADGTYRLPDAVR